MVIILAESTLNFDVIVNFRKRGHIESASSTETMRARFE